jgi:hypothetical protein
MCWARSVIEKSMQLNSLRKVCRLDDLQRDNVFNLSPVAPVILASIVECFYELWPHVLACH